MKNFSLLLVSMWFVQIGAAQILEKENIVDIEKKTAYAGYPSDIRIDDAKKQFQLVYVTKEKKKEIRRNRLVFDYDLNLVDDIQETIPVSGKVDRSKAENADKVKDMPANYRGEEFTTTSLSITGIMNNKIEKVETTYTYNWTSNSYEKKTKVLEQVKTKELVGKPASNPYIGHYVNSDGDLIYLTGTVDKERLVVLSYKAHKINVNLEKELIDEWKFDYVQRQFYAGTLDVNGEPHIIYVFANAGGKVYKKKVNQSPVANEWTYIRLSEKGKVVNRAKFQTKANNWQILGVQEQDGSVFVYGPGESKGVGESHQDLLTPIGTGKQDVFQILKVTGDKVDFVSGPSLDKINDKIVIPASQKKADKYDGKRVDFRNFNIAANGDIFINAQDYSINPQVGYPAYKNLMMFHFAADGTFKRLYSIESQKKKSGVGGVVDPATDPRYIKDRGEVLSAPSGAMYWITYTVKQISKSVASWTEGSYEYTQTTYVPRYTGAIAKFDPEAGTLDAYKELGNDQFLLYAIPSIGIPSIAIDGGTKIVFIGYGSTKETKRKIWLGKLDPLKM